MPTPKLQSTTTSEAQTQTQQHFKAVLAHPLLALGRITTIKRIKHIQILHKAFNLISNSGFVKLDEQLSSLIFFF